MSRNAYAELMRELLYRWVFLWPLYKIACRMQKRGVKPRAANANDQAEAEQAFSRLLHGVIDDWQRRR